MNGFLDLLSLRRSCRRYADVPLEEEFLRKILLAANAAPVGSNRTEDIRLTVVTDRTVMDSFSDAMERRRQDREALASITEKVDDEPVTEPGRFDPFYGAPAVIFVSHRRQDLQPGIEYANAMSVAMAMHLEATDLGLGSVFIWGVLEAMRLYPEYDRTRLLGLPEGFEPLLGLAVGHPAATMVPGSLKEDVFPADFI